MKTRAGIEVRPEVSNVLGTVRTGQGRQPDRTCLARILDSSRLQHRAIGVLGGALYSRTSMRRLAQLNEGMIGLWTRERQRWGFRRPAHDVDEMSEWSDDASMWLSCVLVESMGLAPSTPSTHPM